MIWQVLALIVGFLTAAGTLILAFAALRQMNLFKREANQREAEKRREAFGELMHLVYNPLRREIEYLSDLPGFPPRPKPGAWSAAYWENLKLSSPQVLRGIPAPIPERVEKLLDLKSQFEFQMTMFNETVNKLYQSIERDLAMFNEGDVVSAEPVMVEFDEGPPIELPWLYVYINRRDLWDTIKQASYTIGRRPTRVVLHFVTKHGENHMEGDELDSFLYGLFDTNLSSTYENRLNEILEQLHVVSQELQVLVHQELDKHIQ